MGVREQETGPGGMQWLSRMKRKVTAGGWADTLRWITCPDHVLTLPARPRALSEGFPRNECGSGKRDKVWTPGSAAKDC